MYVREPNRVHNVLRRYEAPIFTKIFPNNESFQRSILFQGTMSCKALPVDVRSIYNIYTFKGKQQPYMCNQIGL